MCFVLFFLFSRWDDVNIHEPRRSKKDKKAAEPDELAINDQDSEEEPSDATDSDGEAEEISEARAIKKARSPAAPKAARISKPKSKAANSSKVARVPKAAKSSSAPKASKSAKSAATDAAAAAAVSDHDDDGVDAALDGELWAELNRSHAAVKVTMANFVKLMSSAPAQARCQLVNALCRVMQANGRLTVEVGKLN